MPKRITRESVLDTATADISDFIKTKPFLNYYVHNQASKQLAPEYLLQFCTQMYDIWGQHPRKWTQKSISTTLLISNPYWPLLTNKLQSTEWFNILTKYVAYLIANGEITGNPNLAKNIEHHLGTRLNIGPNFASSYWLAKLRQLQKTPNFTSSDQYKNYEMQHVSDILLLANNTSFATLFQIYRELTIFQFDIDNVADYLQAGLISIYPKNKTVRSLTFQNDLEAIFDKHKNVIASLLDRIVIVAAQNHLNLRQNASRKAFFKQYQTVLASIAPIDQIQSDLQEVLNGKPLNVMSLLTQTPNTDTTVKGGYDWHGDLRYHFIDFKSGKASYLAPNTMVSIMHFFTANEKPATVLKTTKQVLQSHSNIKHATDYALQTDILVPFVSSEQSIVEVFLTDFQRHFPTKLSGFKMNMTEVAATIYRFYNDLFIQTGRFRRKWTGRSVAQILNDSQLEWINMTPQQASDSYEILAPYIDFLIDNRYLTPSEAIQNVLSDFVDELNPLLDEDNDVLTDQDRVLRLILKLADLFDVTDLTDDADFTKLIAEHEIEAILLAEEFRLGELINLQANAIEFNSQEAYNNYCFNWFTSFLKPTYTKATVAKLTGIPSVLQDNIFWSQVFNKLITSDDPLPCQKRLQVALQIYLGQTEAPNKDQIKNFAAKFDQCRKALEISKTEFKDLLAPDPQLTQQSMVANNVISLDEARKLAKKRHKKR
ncbi:hypothetical protein ACFP1H_02980 [Secundilactobacillus hailunensis]|uniref:PD-(D/E)XK endonuclease-like domain-containing protein n=1 Tax=Secundilactobacillus hailunensis TaxID=2559923 RepID=A0ABW1T7Q9_9LACO|nr:hypothetical protein [Secundilactobacillus hailunensis]